jgi:hypothetical protein
MWFNSSNKEGSGFGQFVLSGREEGYGCCSKEVLLSGNLIVNMLRGLFVLYIVFRTGLILRLTFISVLGKYCGVLGPV